MSGQRPPCPRCTGTEPAAVTGSIVLTEEQIAGLKQRFVEAMAKGTATHTIVLPPPAPGWVLVKGWHDSGTIDAAYGPYTKEYAEWLLGGMLENSTNNWTLIELQAGAPDTREAMT